MTNFSRSASPPAWHGSDAAFADVVVILRALLHHRQQPLVGCDRLRALIRTGVRFRGDVEQLRIVVEEALRGLIEGVEDLRRFLIVLQLEVGAGDAAQRDGRTLNLETLAARVARAGVIVHARIGLAQERKALRIGRTCV